MSSEKNYVGLERDGSVEKMLTSLSEDMGSVPITHTASHSPRGSNTLFWCLLGQRGYLGTLGTESYIQGKDPGT